MNAITNYYLAWLDKEAAEQRMNEASTDAINEILVQKPEGGRIVLDDTHSIELALVPKYNLKRKRGSTAQLWRALQAVLTRLQKQVSETIAKMRELGEEYAAENEAYEPEWTTILRVINLQKEKSSKRENHAGA